MPALLPLEARSCDGCAMCCKLPKIPALGKKEGEWCTHCSSRKQCDAYETRPEPCRDFFCLYRTNLNLTEDWKPSACQMLLTQKPSDGGEMLVVMVEPARANAWRKEPYYTNFKQWSQMLQLVVSIGLRRIVVFPDHEVDLGVLAEGDVIEFIGIPQADGTLRKTAQLRQRN